MGREYYFNMDLKNFEHKSLRTESGLAVRRWMLLPDDEIAAGKDKRAPK